MAKKNDMLTAIRTTAEFLKDSDRPKVCTLRVSNLETLERTPKGVQYTRKSLRAFAKAILTERQSFGDGIYILKNENVKLLKDAKLGELLSSTNPNGVSKYYTTIRRMVYSNIVAESMEQHLESKTQKTGEDLFTEEGDLKPFEPKASKKPSKSSKKTTKKPSKKAGKVKTARKPKVSKTKKAVSKETVTLTAVVNGMNLSTTLLKEEWENTNRQHWVNQCIEAGVPSTGSKKEMAIRVGVVNSLVA